TPVTPCATFLTTIQNGMQITQIRLISADFLWISASICVKSAKSAFYLALVDGILLFYGKLHMASVVLEAKPCQ
ncbi:MAG: hypothetical protein ACE5HA_16875, partial [Anaerolineae bacterium]